uniref:Tudor domain-containing protein n=1 Tax=viral metagenome TaxID=1070528 RepID=A0A6C0EPW8_9ZZZZ
MIPFSRTSIVYNNPNKLVGLQPFYYRIRSSDTNLTSNTPANQYQRLKQIQNTVRVPASLYTSNLGSLNAYQKPTVATYGVCWNQMSDRPIPSVQKTAVPTGSNSSLNRKHTSVTSSRPGGQSPGGVGCDIKHNSYDRYLNRLKGKGPLRRGVIPPNFGTPVIPFNPAFPVYGAKTTKTSIVSSSQCDCPIQTNNTASNIQIYNNPLYYPYPSAQYAFNVGDFVYAMQSGNNFFTRATILQVLDGDNYEIEFDNGIVETQNITALMLYFPCNCGAEMNGVSFKTGFILNYANNTYGYTCLLPNYPALQEFFN